MADVSYVPGTRVAVAGDQCWALVETPPDAPAVARTWRQVGQGAAPDALLAGLLADGLDGTAGFTLLAAGTDGHYRLFCRGTVGATIVTAPPADGGAAAAGGRNEGVSDRIDGAGLLTWREQVVPAGAERIFLGEPPAEADLRLPAASGVLLAGCVIVELTSLAARDTVPYGTGWPAGETRHDTGLVELVADRGAAVQVAGKQTIVFLPDTITIPHPGSLVGHGNAAPATGGDGWPDGIEPVTAQGPAVTALPAPVGTGAASAASSAEASLAPDGTVEVLSAAVRPRAPSQAAVNQAAVNPAAASPAAASPAAVNQTAVNETAVNETAVDPSGLHHGPVPAGAAVPPGIVHPGAVHQGEGHPGAVHPRAVHPGAAHPGAVPQGALPQGAVQQGGVQPGPDNQGGWPGGGPGAGEYAPAAGAPPARTVADVPVRFAHDPARTGRPGGSGSPARHLPPEGGPPAGPPWGNGFAGQGGQALVRYPEVPPSAQPWSGPPGSGHPWEPPAGPPRPWEPPAGQPQPWEAQPLEAQPWEPDGPARPVPPPPPPPQPGPAPAAAGLIDVPPWLAGPGGPGPGGGTLSGPPAPLSGPPAPLSGPPAPLSAPSAPAPAPARLARLAAPPAEAGQGEPGPTMNRGELSELAARTAPPDRIGPVVPALICPSGHVNPPSGGACRRCGAALPHDPVLVPRPVLGVLRLSLGDVIALDRGVVMGRNPRTDFAGAGAEAGGGERPHVVKLPSADGDISRTHLRVTLDGWHVLVTDLNSTNGTLVTLPGRESQQLRPGEPVPIQPGTVVTLADGIDFRYEVTE